MKKKTIINYSLLWEKFDNYAIKAGFDFCQAFIYHRLDRRSCIIIRDLSEICKYITPKIESEVDNILERWFPKCKYNLLLQDN